MFTQFFKAANDQWQALRKKHQSLFLTSRTTQTFCVVATGALCAILVFISLVSAQRNREQWAQSRAVVVASVDLNPGDSLSLDNTKFVSLPNAILTSDALYDIPDDATVRIALRAHTVLSTSLVNFENTIGAIPSGWRIVALPKSLSTPPLNAGDSVEIVGGTSVIAQSAFVVSVEPLTVAVPPSESAVVAAAARMGEISLVVSR